MDPRIPSLSRQAHFNRLIHLTRAHHYANDAFVLRHRLALGLLFRVEDWRGGVLEILIWDSLGEVAF